MPMTAETPKPIPIAYNGKVKVQAKPALVATSVTIQLKNAPNKIPNNPANKVIKTASIKNSCKILASLAPKAFFKPISAVPEPVLSILTVKEFVEGKFIVMATQKGIIKIGITPVIGAYFFPAALARFQKIHPRVQVAVIEEGSLSLRKRLARGELDLAMMIISKASSHLETAPVAKGQLLACFSLHNPLSNLAEITFAKLRDQPFIMFREDTYSRKMILDECARNKFTPRIVFSSSQIETVMGMVGHGVGISFLLDTIVTKYPEVVGRPLSKPLLIEAGLAWSKDRYQSKAAKLLMESFLEAP